jgi:hypothetical protein
MSDLGKLVENGSDDNSLFIMCNLTCKFARIKLKIALVALGILQRDGTESMGETERERGKEGRRERGRKRERERKRERRERERT